MDSLRVASPPPPSSRPRSYTQVPAARPASVLQSKFVYIPRGGTVPSLQPLYAGPYRVVSSSDKCFNMQMGGKMEVVSGDRLKPYLGRALVSPGPARGRSPMPPSLSSSTLPP